MKLLITKSRPPYLALKFGAVFISSIAIVLILSNDVLAFSEETTHPALTEQIVEFYNLAYPEDKISDEQKALIVQGSIDEDAAPRWINHFYDPLYNEGWKGELAGIWPSAVIRDFSLKILSSKPPVTSKQWSRDRNRQAQYALVKGDHTWQAATDGLAFQPASPDPYYSIGFILHLLEDATVPDHTRNDTHAHPLEWATRDYGSPYEEYTKVYATRESLQGLGKQLFNSGLRPKVFQNLDQHFDELAMYSNNFFFSKDTIYSEKYLLPSVIKHDEKIGYGRDKTGEIFPLVYIKKIFDDELLLYVVKFILPDNDQDALGASTVLNNYFTRHSREAIIHGAGVLRLWRDWARDVAKNGALENPSPKFVLPVISPTILWPSIKSLFTKNVIASFPSVSLLLLYQPTLGQLYTPPNLVGALQIPLATLELIMKNYSASLTFGSLNSNNKSTPALLISPNDSILADLAPYLTIANPNDTLASTIQKMAILAKEAGEKTNAVIAESNQLASEALAGVAQATVSQMKAANQEAFNQSIERYISGYGSQFKTKAEAEAAKWPWDTFLNRPYIMPQTSVISVQDAIPDGAYVRLSGNSQLYQKNGHRLSPMFGGDAAAAVTVPFRAQEWNQSGNVVGPWYGIFLNNLRPVELRSPNYWGGMIFYQNQTTGKLYNDPNGKEPLSAGYVRNLEINGYLPRRVNTYEEDLNDTVTPRVVHGRRITAGQAMDEAIRDGAGRPASNAATDTIGNPPSLLDRALDWIADAYQHIKDAVISVIDKVVSVVEKIGKIIVNAARSVAKTMVAGAKAIVNAVVAMGETAAKAMDAVLALPGQALDWVKGKVASAAPMVAGAYRQVVGGIGSVLGRLGW